MCLKLYPKQIIQKTLYEVSEGQVIWCEL